MKNIRFVYMLSFLLLINLANAQNLDNNNFIVHIGQQVPDNFILQLNNNQQLLLKDLKGKVILLQFTSSWCAICREEMPHLENEIWKKYKDSGLVLIGIDRDTSMEVCKKFAADMKISYPLALDPHGDIFRKFARKNAGVTKNVLIDRNGKIVFLTSFYNEEQFTALKNKIAELF